MSTSQPDKSPTAALVLGGGGARAAYQAGVLSYLAEAGLITEFPLLTGVSAGAINAVHLAHHTGSLIEASEDLVGLWESITVEQVFRTDPRALGAAILGWGARLLSGGLKPVLNARGLVDTQPLREFLLQALGSKDGALPAIQQKLDQGRLKAVAVTAINYSTGLSDTWVQGNDVALWRRPMRRGVASTMTVDHIMASTALPMFFPSIEIDGCWFGDGGVRLTSPLSPALHLGAERIFAISTRYPRTADEAEEKQISGYPPPAQILGVLMNSILIDMLDYDSTQVSRITDLVEQLPNPEESALRPAKVFTLRPSQDLGKLAGQYELQLPRMFRFLERGLGSQETKSPDFLSYLLFQHDYIAQLIDLGRQDAQARRSEIATFLSAPNPVSPPPLEKA